MISYDVIKKLDVLISDGLKIFNKKKNLKKYVKKMWWYVMWYEWFEVCNGI